MFNLFTKQLSFIPTSTSIPSNQSTSHRLLFKLGILLTTIFLFLTTTTLVSFTLKETQQKMIHFTFLLQHHVRHGLPYASLVFHHVVESLVFVPIMVGILFFLFEFFSDQLIAFLLLSLVWVCEVFSVVSLRSYPSIKYFPRILFLYFTLFHIYFFCFPQGFSHLAMITTCLFLVHSMAFFWNRYEVPALETGIISPLHPRMISNPNPSSTIPSLSSLLTSPPPIATGPGSSVIRNSNNGIGGISQQQPSSLSTSSSGMGSNEEDNNEMEEEEELNELVSDVVIGLDAESSRRRVEESRRIQQEQMRNMARVQDILRGGRGRRSSSSSSPQPPLMPTVGGSLNLSSSGWTDAVNQDLYLSAFGTEEEDLDDPEDDMMGGEGSENAWDDVEEQMGDEVPGAYLSEIDLQYGMRSLNQAMEAIGRVDHMLRRGEERVLRRMRRNRVNSEPDYLPPPTTGQINYPFSAMRSREEPHLPSHPSNSNLLPRNASFNRSPLLNTVTSVDDFGYHTSDFNIFGHGLSGEERRSQRNLQSMVVNLDGTSTSSSSSMSNDHPPPSPNHPSPTINEEEKRSN